MSDFNLEAARAKAKAIESEIASKRDELKILYEAIANHTAVFKVGDRIWLGIKNKKMFEISAVYSSGTGDASYRAKMIKKDGTAGQVEKRLYRWDVQEALNNAKTVANNDRL
jgi:hypothetical protein